LISYCVLYGTSTLSSLVCPVHIHIDNKRAPISIFKIRSRPTKKRVLTIATGVTPLVFGRHDLSPLSIDDSREHLLRCCTRCAFKHRPYCR